MMSRRKFIAGSVAAGVAAGTLGRGVFAQNMAPISGVGISASGMGKHRNGMGVIPPMGDDLLTYIDYCRSLGAGGIHFSSPGRDLAALRSRMDELGMWYEGNARPPSSLSESTDAFEQSLRDALELGADVVRYVSPRPSGTSGRRYGSFTSLEEYTAWREEAFAVVLKCLPIAERMGIRIALENHKDFMVDEHADFLHRVSSEYLGALVDPGNNISLLEQPEETCSKLAPYVFMVSMKEMGVAPYEEGFLLSEVPMGSGGTDQAKLWDILKGGNPDLRFSVEMITRDPLEVPVLTEGYWASIPHRSAADLARHMQWVRDNAIELPYVDHLSPQEQLQLEEDNNRQCIEWARTHIAGV